MPVRGIYFEADREAFSFTTVVKKPLKDIAKGRLPQILPL